MVSHLELNYWKLKGEHEKESDFFGTVMLASPSPHIWEKLLTQARQVALICLVLAGLFHAWGGHDFLFGHHHKQLGEASLSTSSGFEQSQRAGQSVVAPPELLDPLLPEVPLQTVRAERPPSKLIDHSAPVCLERDHPRPPPRPVI